MLQKSIVFATIASAIMLSILLLTTTPLTTGPLGILGFFIFMYVTALGVLTFLIRGTNLTLVRLMPVRTKRMKIKQLSLKESYYYASAVALAPVMLVAMQSVGQIGVYQVLLVVFFVTVAWLYITNRTS